MYVKEYLYYIYTYVYSHCTRLTKHLVHLPKAQGHTEYYILCGAVWHLNKYSMCDLVKHELSHHRRWSGRDPWEGRREKRVLG